MNTYFLSHASVHKPFCDSLKTQLEARGHRAWLDAYDLHVGESIPGSVADGIYESDYFVLLLTPEIHDSVWVAWELKLAVYREVEVLRRTFVIPALHKPTDRPRLIAHKRYADFRCDPSQAAGLLLAETGAGATVIKDALPANAVKLIARVIPKAARRFSTRKLEDAFWEATVGAAGRFRSFPLVDRSSGLSLGRARVVVGRDLGERESVSVLDESGLAVVAETTYGVGVQPILDAQQVVMKLGLFAPFAYAYALALGLKEGVTLNVSIQGLDRPFTLGYDPSDLTQKQLIPVTAMSLAPGEELEASHELAVDGKTTPQDLLTCADELQADLFHRLRLPANPLIGTHAASVRFTSEAVRLHVMAALRMAIFQG